MEANKISYCIKSGQVIVLILSLVILFRSFTALGQTQPTDHFRSRVSDSWNLSSTWESSPDGVNWIISNIIPDYQSNSITICSNHIVHTDQIRSADELVIENDGKLVVNNTLTIQNGDGVDLLIYGSIEVNSFVGLSVDAEIFVKNGGKYIQDIGKETRISRCTWETGSTIILKNTIDLKTASNLDQTFFNFIWDGSISQNEYNLNLPDQFNINGNFTIDSEKKIYLTQGTTPTELTIQGDFILLKRPILELCRENGGLVLNIDGNMILGSDNLNARLGLGNSVIKNNIVELKGDLIININSGINKYTGQVNGTLRFTNNLSSQVIYNSGTIQNIKINVGPGSHVQSSTLSLTPLISVTIEENAILEVPTLINTDPAKLILNNNSSLVTNSSVSGTMHRTLTNADWTVPLDGWHLLSSPVESQSLVLGGFLQAPYDFYSWSEDQNLWLNQKVPGNDISSFVPGHGYFVSYDTGGIKTYSGILNNSSINFSNLSVTGTSPYSGYHLLGNPFPCAIDWSSNGWNRQNISEVANIWSETACNYLPVTNTSNNKIAANQGFFVQALNVNNSISIPVESRIIANTPFLKNEGYDGLIHFKVLSENNGTWDELIIQIHGEASCNFDKLDGHKMQGSEYAPQFYSELPSNEKLCVNTLPSKDSPLVVPLFFEPGVDDEYLLFINDFTFVKPVFLEDIVTGSITLLADSSVYSFNATSGDEPRRFLLHMDPVSLPEQGYNSPLRVYSYGNGIYFKLVNEKNNHFEYSMIDITGKRVAEGKIENKSLSYKQFESLPTGLYIINVNGKYYRQSFKILLEN